MFRFSLSFKQRKPGIVLIIIRENIWWSDHDDVDADADADADAGDVDDTDVDDADVDGADVDDADVDDDENDVGVAECSAGLDS